ncbi:MAG: hypothetical protein OXJ90_25185 [Spirochaetaceae bacterium]|nr:hypothetical protein [Spirochaetaceae bacterium]
MADCDRLRYVHSRSDGFAARFCRLTKCAVRSLRHRDTLVKTAVRSVKHMQKAFDQMNVHLHWATSDLTGRSGLATADAILPGRTSRTRSAWRHWHLLIRASRVCQRAGGDLRSEHLFTLQPARRPYAHYQQLIHECDQEIESRVRAFGQRTSRRPHLPPTTNSGVP